MKSVLAVLASVLALQGCGSFDRAVAGVVGVAHSCIEGVEYLQFTSGVTVAYLPNGNVKTCK